MPDEFRDAEGADETREWSDQGWWQAWSWSILPCYGNESKWGNHEEEEEDIPDYLAWADLEAEESSI